VMPRKSKAKAALLPPSSSPANDRLPNLRSLLLSRGHDTAELRKFLDGGGSPNVRSTWGRLKPFSLLHMLQFLHEMKKIEQLSSIDMVLRAGAAIDAFCCSQIPGEPDKTVLMEAAQYNSSLELLVLLLSRGASVCLQTTPYGDTALHLEADKGLR
jgi:hypothetical protein